MDWNLAVEKWIDAVGAVDRYIARVIAGDDLNPDELVALRAALEAARQRCEDAVMDQAGFNWEVEVPLQAQHVHPPDWAVSANGSEYSAGLKNGSGEPSPK